MKLMWYLVHDSVSNRVFICDSIMIELYYEFKHLQILFGSNNFIRVKSKM